MSQEQAGGSEHDICALEEIEDGGKHKAKVGEVPLVLFRSGDQVFALRNRCAHMNFPLSLGAFDGRYITCRLHRARFDVKTGQLDKKAWFFGGFGSDCVPTYPVSIRDGRIFVALPD